MRRLLFATAAGLAAAFLLRAPVDAQVRPIYDRGAAGLTQTLERLQTTASALHTGAHPDDEDSAFIARVARGDHARVAYLALNRGEGGQNILGTELFDALGVIRTEELLQARALDGGEQFFTRTFDYGFSKSRAEAAALWNERETLGDMVRVIRMFRPLVVYSRFSGTEADGHGHHQMAGYLTPQAFRAAGDPGQFPEQIAEGLRPWQPRKLYRGSGRGGGPPATIEVQTGELDPVIGRSFAAISLEGRSQHKSQSMGTIEAFGPQSSGLLLVESLTDDPDGDSSLFDGIDVTVAGLAALAGLPDGSLAAELRAMDGAARQALDTYDPLHPETIVPALATGLRATREARARLATLGADADARADADFLLAVKEDDFASALVQAAGVFLDPLADSETVVQGEALALSVRTFVEGAAGARVLGSRLAAPAGWTVTAAPPAPPQGGRGGFARREEATAEDRYLVQVPADAEPTQPYFLEQPRVGARYQWTDDAPKALPFAPPLLQAIVTLEIGGEQVELTRPVEYRYADQIRGELRRAVNVVPAVSVGLDSPFLIVPLGDAPRDQRVVVRTTSFSTAPLDGTLRLRLPEGWTAAPAEVAFHLESQGDRTAAAFTVTAPGSRTEGSFDIVAEATVGGRTYARDVQTVEYPHIQTHRLYWPARTTAQVLPLEVAPVSVGYVMGSGDSVPDAIRRLGVDVTLIDGDMLATGDLDVFDTIVVGVRASEARPEFVANNGRLLDYVRRGGTLVVQYQQNDYAARNLAPYAVEQQGNSRVTDELARVRILEPQHPLFTFPNRITEDDFADWVQERNLYALTGFDAAFTPLLESADPGEDAQIGGELYAEYGEGRFVYTAYAWFRQLPAGVPGAYRQFANLISLSRAP